MVTVQFFSCGMGEGKIYENFLFWSFIPVMRVDGARRSVVLYAVNLVLQD